MCKARVPCVLLWLAAAVGIVGMPVIAQEGEAGALPLERVVLFTSGVGFFDRQGEVEDDAEVSLKFNVEDVNDLLKSMVVQDFGSGRVSAVSYGSRDPVTRTLKTFAIDLTGNPSFAELLKQIRGERVTVEAPSKIVGTLVGVERHEERVEPGNRTIPHDVLVLLTEEGLLSLRLDRIGRLKLESAGLDREFRAALAVLALENATDKKTVTCRFRGEGRRTVRIAYIQEAPIWKTSYRLVLTEDRAPFLQGWAIVENTTEEDWNGVQLTLVSGRPISFIMDLYQPLYLQRPVVQHELYASVRPPTHEREVRRAPSSKSAVTRRARGAYNGPAGSVAPAPTPTGTPTPGGASAARGYARFDLAKGVAAAAQGAEVGELFQYLIEAPVTLARQRSAMLPIVNAEVKGEKVSVYNASVHAAHPLNAFRLTNSTALHLMQGPITVFDGGTYAGDARIKDLKPGETRLISYALDLAVEVRTDRPQSDERITAARVVKGVMLVSRKYRRTARFTVKNTAREPKVVLLEHARDAGWRLLEPSKPEEETRSYYRLKVTVGAGASETLTVTEERVASQQMALTSLSDQNLGLYLERREIGEAIRAALTEAMRRKAEIAELEADKLRLVGKTREISQDQERMRRIMEHVDRQTDLYRRYLKKLETHEDRIEEARAAIRKLDADVVARRKALEAYLIGLNVDG